MRDTIDSYIAGRNEEGLRDFLLSQGLNLGYLYEKDPETQRAKTTNIDHYFELLRSRAYMAMNADRMANPVPPHVFAETAKRARGQM